MEFSVDNLCGFLIRSKLMTSEEMVAMRQRWNSEARDTAAQVPLFLKWITSNHYVTEYQATLLGRGHVDDFFLGQYKILERIGRGRMAGVYKAIHPSGQVVAIKVLPPSRAKNSQLLGRFQREARLAVKLKHVHVVRSFQVGDSKSVHYLVMEYLEGETLDEILHRRKRLPSAEAVRMVYQALIGLQHIHELGLVHRDLKPANLIVVPAPARGEHDTTLKSNLKILDIGLARELFDENSPAPTPEQGELTGEGALLGTPDYLAPEQARDPRTIDIRADIYSLGCVLYHLLTGQTPFPDRNILNQMIRHATETPRPLHDFPIGASEGLQQIVNWMMAKQPDQRYPTPARAAQALQAFMLVTSESNKAPEETPQLRRYLTWLELDKDKAPESPTLLLDRPPDPPAKLLTPISPPSPPAAAATKPAPNFPAPLSSAPVAASSALAATPIAAPLSAPAASPVPAPAAAPVVATPLVAVPRSTPARAPAGNIKRFLASTLARLRNLIFALSKRDWLMFGAGVGLMLILVAVYNLLAFLVRWLAGN